MTVPDMGRLLGLDRKEAWKVYRHAKGQLELIRVAERPRITKESFEKWYVNQKWYQMQSEGDQSHEKAAAEPEHKEYVTIS